MKEFTELQKEFATINEDVWGDAWWSWFSFIEIDGLFKIHYFGDGYDDFPNNELKDTDKEDNYPYIALLELVSNHSTKIHSLEFRGPDQGANGVRSWNFQRLINSNCLFSNLESFKVELTDPGYHNISVIASDDDCFIEGGTMARLISKMPALDELIIPSAPNSEFFKLWHKTELTKLTIQSGFQSEQFIENYSKCKKYPEITAFDFSDVSFISDQKEREKLATTEQEFRALFSSTAFKSVNHVKLRNTHLTDEQLSNIASQFPELQLLVIRSPHGEYAE